MLLLTTAVLSILIFSVNSIIYGVSVGYGKMILHVTKFDDNIRMNGNFNFYSNR